MRLHADGVDGLRHLRAPGHRVRLSSDGLDGLDTWPGTHRAAGWRRGGRPDRDEGRRRPTVRAGVRDEAPHRDRGAGRRAGGDRRPRRAGRPAGLHRAAPPLPRLRAPVRRGRADRGRRARAGSTATPPTSSSARSSASGPTVPFAEYVREAVLAAARHGRHHGGRLTRASGAASTLDDLLRFAGELLDPGRVLAPEVLAEATAPQLPDLDGVLPGFGRRSPNPWGLGFELRDHKDPHWTPPEASPGHVRSLRPVRRRSCGSIRWPAWPASCSPTTRSGRGRWTPGRPWGRPSWRRRQGRFDRPPWEWDRRHRGRRWPR